MIRSIAVALSLGLAVPAWAEDTVPGRATELQEGAPAPYTGSLVDRERMGVILAKRVAAELERDALRLEVLDARAKQAAAEAAGGPSWGVLIGVTATALVVGVAGGVALVYAARR